MKQVTRYKCDFCKKELTTPRGIITHEQRCMYNPDGKNCYMCEHSREEEADGVFYCKPSPYCGKKGAFLSAIGNVAHKCEHFKRSDEPYFLHKDCTPLPDAF